MIATHFSTSGNRFLRVRFSRSGAGVSQFTPTSPALSGILIAVGFEYADEADGR